MEKKTVIANLRAEITLTDSMRHFLGQFDGQNQNIWVVQDGGDAFLHEFSREWNTNFIEIAQDVADAYFRRLHLSEERLPRVELTDYRKGSWIMEAALTMFGTVGSTYTVLKGLSELAQIADGLEKTKNLLQSRLTARFQKKIPERIEPLLPEARILCELPLSIPGRPASVACSIDARPLRSLTPDVAKSHAIHLAVAVSRSAVSVENLSDEVIENLQIGLVKSATQRHRWWFGDAYSKSIPRLGGRQSTSLSVDQFTLSSDGTSLELVEPNFLYVDCWLQDNAGIYLFNFLIE